MEKIITQNRGFIRSVIKKITGSYNEDLEQEVYIKTWKNLDNYQEQGQLKSWLAKIAKNVCLDYFKSSGYQQQTREICDEQVLQNKAVVSNADKILDAKTRQKIILKAIDELPPKMRKVIYWFEFEDMPISDIAKRLGEPEGTIKSRLHNARKILAEKLNFLRGE